MATDTVSIAEFVKTNGISITSEYADRNPNMDGSADMDNYKCTLTRRVAVLTYKCRDIGYGVESGKIEGHWTGEVDTWGKRTFQPADGSDPLYLFPDEIVRDSSKIVARMTLYFSKGVGHHGAEPTAEEVLSCLASDSAGIENARGFEDFCNEYGYDTDSRKAEKTYKTCEHQAKRLRNFLGDDLYDRLLWHTDQM